MKLHLPNSLFRALIACFALSVAITGTSFAERVDSVIYTTHQDDPLDISEKAVVSFENIEYFGHGAAIHQVQDESTNLSLNDSVLFSGNTAIASGNPFGGAILNAGIITMRDNGAVTFMGNTTSSVYPGFGSAISNAGGIFMLGNGDVTFSGNASHGGTIYNSGTFILCGNENVSFIGNMISTHPSNAMGGAIVNNNGYLFTLSGNGDVSFSGNSANRGGAIFTGPGDFILRGNGNVTFSGNSAWDGIGGAIANWGGVFTLSSNGNVTFRGNSILSDSDFGWGAAIYNNTTFSLSGNGDVLFEKNAEVHRGIYRLRSIYSAEVENWSWGITELNLSASENHSITFRDSIYAEEMVNLNQDGRGDIIFTGATTEADLREVKGGIDGTAEEILNSRTSEIATNASLYGGRLIVEAGAILKGQGITFTDDADATIRLNGGTLDETGYAIAVSAGSGLEFEGENLLNAASVQMADGAFLSFVMGEGSGTNWDAQLITGQLNVQLSGDFLNEHRLLTLADASQYDTSLWTSDVVTVSGASFESLRWVAGVLTYIPDSLHKDLTLDVDGSLDDVLPDDGYVSINGNGHSLTVKNEVQLVQMALKDGIVKLEGENNNIVSVTLTEGGELVLTAGAGLKTGDIISMVASGKGELVISGDITLDNKGMKGKAGAQATVSHADAQVLGDATISNVRVEDSVIDLAEGSTVTFSHVSLAASSRITDDPATLALDDVTAELKLGVNTAVVSVNEVLHAGSKLVQNGNETMSLTLTQDAVVVQLNATTFDSVTLTGDSLVLQLSGVETEFFNGADYIAVFFTSGTGLATFGTDVEVLLTLDEEHFIHGYYVQGGDHTAMLFATSDKAVVTPEPATATLSLLALAALAARHKRK